MADNRIVNNKRWRGPQCDPAGASAAATQCCPARAEPRSGVPARRWRLGSAVNHSPALERSSGRLRRQIFLMEATPMRPRLSIPERSLLASLPPAPQRPRPPRSSSASWPDLRGPGPGVRGAAAVALAAGKRRRAHTPPSPRRAPEWPGHNAEAVLSENSSHGHAA